MRLTSKPMLVAAAAFALTGTAAHAAQIGDGTFNNSDWSLTVFTNSASNVAASQAVAAGPHGSFRSVTDFDGDAGGSVQNSLVLGANIYTAAEYNPAAQGALAALNMSIDSISPSPTAAARAMVRPMDLRSCRAARSTSLACLGTRAPRTSTRAG